MIKKIKKIDYKKILIEYDKISKNIEWFEITEKGKQTSLQYKEEDNIWNSGVGKSKGIEFEFNKLNPYFKNTIFEEIINEFNLFRARLMWSNPFSCYSMHVDYTPRIHIPLITNKDCYFLFKDSRPEHMEAGHVFWVDTRLPHTFINCSFSPRLHLIGVVEE